jgi:hypothetical protein
VASPFNQGRVIVSRAVDAGTDPKRFHAIRREGEKQFLELIRVALLWIHPAINVIL